MFKVNNKATGKSLGDIFLAYIYLFKVNNISIVDFEQVNVSWVVFIVNFEHFQRINLLVSLSH